MGVDFGGIQVVMAQDLLDCPHIHTVLQHQRGSRVPQLVGGILGTVDTGFAQTLFHHGVDHGAADALIPGGQKQSVLVPALDGPPHRQPAVQGILAGVI